MPYSGIESKTTWLENKLLTTQPDSFLKRIRFFKYDIWFSHTIWQTESILDIYCIGTESRISIFLSLATCLMKFSPLFPIPFWPHWTLRVMFWHVHHLLSHSLHFSLSLFLPSSLIAISLHLFHNERPYLYPSTLFNPSSTGTKPHPSFLPPHLKRLCPVMQVTWWPHFCWGHIK